MGKYSSYLLSRLVIAVTVTLLFTGCTWVRLTSEGQAVQVAETGQTGGCQRVGRATAQTRSRVTVVDRSSERVQEELLILARNEAARMGGNTVVPESVITDGSQTYIVYTCP